MGKQKVQDRTVAGISLNWWLHIDQMIDHCALLLFYVLDLFAFFLFRNIIHRLLFSADTFIGARGGAVGWSTALKAGW